MQDPNFKRGYRFDHVWKIVKDFEKFKGGVSSSRQASRRPTINLDTSSESENPTPESPMPASPAL